MDANNVVAAIIFAKLMHQTVEATVSIVVSLEPIINSELCLQSTTSWSLEMLVGTKQAPYEQWKKWQTTVNISCV